MNIPEMLTPARYAAQAEAELNRTDDVSSLADEYCRIMRAQVFATLCVAAASQQVHSATTTRVAWT